MQLDPLMSHNQEEIDHVRLVFFQIRVENLKMGPSGFQFFVCFDVIRSENQSQCRILSQRGPPGCAWVVLICSLDTKYIQLKTGWTHLSFFNPNLRKQQPYMVNLCLIMSRQRDSTHIPSSHCLCYVFQVKYLTTNNTQQLILLEIEHLIFFHLMLVLVEQIFIV